MVEAADVITAYRTYPHIDMKETGARAMAQLLARIAHERAWARRWQPIDFFVPITAQCTMAPPMQQIYAVLPELAAACGAVDLSLSLGFPYCDFEGCGPAITAYAETQAAADAAASRLLQLVLDQRANLAAKLWPAAEAVAHARAQASLGGPPIVLADTQDNPGGGGHGDTTGLLSALVAGGASGAVIGVLNDPASAAAAHAAGEGAVIELSLGGVSDGVPHRGRFTVLALGDGRFTCTGPMTKGNAADLGPTALLETEGVHVVVASRKMQAYDQAMFRHVGIEPASVPIIALKSSVHFRADFQPIAKEILVVLAPGPVVADPSTLPFTKLRPGLALAP
jgi:microcystin degradation protein MlrC